MVHGELVGGELLVAVVAGALVELIFPPGCAFEFAGFFAFFANTFGVVGVGADFEVLFARQIFYLPLAPPYQGGESNRNLFYAEFRPRASLRQAQGRRFCLGKRTQKQFCLCAALRVSSPPYRILRRWLRTDQMAQKLAEFILSLPEGPRQSSPEGLVRCYRSAAHNAGEKNKTFKVSVIVRN